MGGWINELDSKQERRKKNEIRRCGGQTSLNETLARISGLQ